MRGGEGGGGYNTWKLNRRHKVVKDEFGKDAEAVVVLKEEELWFGCLGGLGCLEGMAGCQSRAPRAGWRGGERRKRWRTKKVGEFLLTRRFFNATNTLGADTTAILVSAVAPARRCLARSVAVSSEYCSAQQGSVFESLA